LLYIFVSSLVSYRLHNLLLFFSSSVCTHVSLSTL